MFFKQGGNENIGLNGMAIEATVLGTNGGLEAFTENGIEIWYYETPVVQEVNVNGAPVNQE